MIFGPCPLDDAEGAVLAHRLKVGDITLKKGHVLSAFDIHFLRTSGHSSLIVARAEDGDICENEAALTIANMIQGSELDHRQPFTGRCNLYAKAAGLFIYDNELVNALNLIDESITLATLPNFSPVIPGQLVGTVKIIPFFVPQSVLDSCRSIVHGNSSLLYVAPFQKKTVALIQTELSGIKQNVYTKTSAITKKRIESLGGVLDIERRCAHTSSDIVKSLRAVLQSHCDLILISGASAIVDRRDVIPSAILETGGSIIHFGMPVDPGNLMLLAAAKDNRPILGLPGCARSPQVNGLDWILQRLCAGIPLSGKDIQLMGGGGLLTEAEEEGRPSPRNPLPKIQNIGAVVLAAGRSSRMKGPNKLLEKIKGIPIIVHTLQNILRSKARPITAVVGHEADSICREIAQAGLTDVDIVSCPTYEMGLSHSLKTGIASLPSNTDAAVICLADMPFIQPDDIDRLVTAFNPAKNHLIIVPVHQGRRGNPIVLGKNFFPQIMKLDGDKGARQILAQHKDSILEVEFDHERIFTDIDSPEDLTRARDI